LSSKPTNRSDEEMAMRALIVPELRKRYPTARIIHELPVRYSTNRIDLAAVTESEIVSVEIKSSKDVMYRLEAQLRAFKPICSRIIAALAPRWNEQLPPVKSVPYPGVHHSRPQYTETQEIIRRVGGVEIWTVDAGASAITVTAGDYYRPRKPWLAQMLDMLHVAELTEIAAHHQVCVHKRPNHLTLVSELVDMLQGREVVAAVCRALRARDAFCDGTDAPIIVEPKAAAASESIEQERLAL
jgi:hypothetical protein